jgi:hypothetical protein
MARSVLHYSQFLSRLAGLVGLPSDRITTELAASWNTFFNTNYTDMWQRAAWLEASPFGEARFVGNLLTYPNDLTKTANWTATAITTSYAPAGVPNPVDGRLTVSKLLETTANSAHKVAQSVTFLPSTTYQISCYARPNQRNYLYLWANDGVTTYSSFFNVATGAVGTASNCTATISQQASGFYLCTITFTSNAAAVAGTANVAISTDGSTTSYAGDAAKGLYVWGVLGLQTTNVPPTQYVLSWTQTGENAIDTLFDIYQTNPTASQYPRAQGYQLGPDGATMISGNWNSYYVNGVNQNNIYGSLPANPVFIYYRKEAPLFEGSTYSASATYSVDQQVYFTSTTGYGDYYKCIVATTAGQSPDTTASSWEVLPVYATFFDFTLYQSFADWLVSDGQQEKAAGMYAVAQSKMDDQFDIMERQMATIFPLRVQTHTSTQARFR